MTCVYWEDKSTEEGQTMRWSVDGCWVSFSHENYTVCSCSHLSTFALILQISEVNICASTFHIPSAHHSLGRTLTLFSVLAKLRLGISGWLLQWDRTSSLEKAQWGEEELSRRANVSTASSGCRESWEWLVLSKSSVISSSNFIMNSIKSLI